VRRAGGVVWVRSENESQLWSAEAELPPNAEAALQHSKIATYTAIIAPTALMRLATGERLPLHALQGQPLTIVCGIARPQRFLQTAHRLGYTAAETHLFPDHHPYTPDDLRMLAGKTVLTTLKDAVKLRGRFPDDGDAYALLIEAQLDDALRRRILSMFTGTPTGSRES
jgi:tetraacyldisaccharide-1-P 4'-kinase